MVFTHDLDFGAILAATGAQYNGRQRSKLREINPQKIESSHLAEAIHYRGLEPRM